MPPTSAGTRLGRSPSSITNRNRSLCHDWLRWLEAHGRANITVYQYGGKCDELIEFIGDTPLDTISLDKLEAWVARPRKGRGRGQLGSDAVRAKDVIVLRGLYKWAVAHGHFTHDPTVNLEMPTVRNENPKAIDADVWKRFWAGPLTDEERVAFGLGFFGGLRRLEMCVLGPQHFNLDTGAIEGFKRKGDRGRNSGKVPIASLAHLFAERHDQLLPRAEDFLGPLKALVEARAGRSEWLLPWGERSAAMYPFSRGTARPVPGGMTSPDQINHALRHALLRCGMDGRAFTPHALRHSFVTYLLRAEVPLEVASKLSNHSNVDITLRYTRIADDPIAEMLSLKGSRW